jgi:predicted transcriptional regulator
MKASTQVTATIPTGIVERLDDIARTQDRSRSKLIARLLEQSLTGEDCRRGPEQIANTGESNAA